MDKTVLVAVDVGTELIKILSVRQNPETNKITTLLKSVHPSRGFSRGYIVDALEATRVIQEAINHHQSRTGIKISEALFSVGGVGLKSKIFTLPHSIAGSEVTNFDLNKIEEKAKSLIDKKIPGYLLESLPIKYTVDGFDHYSPPLKMEAKKIYTDYFFVSLPKNHLTSLENAVENSNILPLEIIPGVLAAGATLLEEKDKQLGCALVDIGSETISIIVYKNNKPLHLGVLPLGSKEITLAISKRERIDFSEAERKKKSGPLSGAARVAAEKKIREIAKEIKTHLKNNLGPKEKLPAGITLTGGGAKIANLDKIFKQTFSWPVKRTKLNELDSETDFSLAYGLITVGLQKEKDRPFLSLSGVFSPLRKATRKLLRKMMV